MSTANVFTIKSEKTLLIDVLTGVGGLPNSAKANSIKIIRGDLNQPQVFKLDLSSLKTLKDAEFEMLPNDIVYVETQKNIPLSVLSQITPILSILTTTFLVINLFK